MVGETHIKKLKSNSGFTLLSLLISFTIEAVLMTFASGAFSRMTRMQGSMESRMAFDNVRQSLQLVFQNPELCKRSLTTPVGETIQFPPQGSFVVQMGGATLASVGMDLGNRTTLTDLRFRIVDGPTSISGVGNRYVALLEMGTGENPERFGASILTNKQAPFLLSIVTDSDGKLSQCSTGSPSPDSAPAPNVEMGTIGYPGEGLEKNLGVNWKQLQIEAGTRGGDIYIYKTFLNRRSGNQVDLRWQWWEYGPQFNGYVTDAQILELDSNYKGCGLWIGCKIVNGELWVKLTAGQAMYTVIR